MLRLKNIKIEKEIIKADFFPEDSLKSGHLIVDLSTEEIISCDDVPGYGASYRGHARQHLIEMAKQGDVRTECIVMWC